MAGDEARPRPGPGEAVARLPVQLRDGDAQRQPWRELHECLHLTLKAGEHHLAPGEAEHPVAADEPRRVVPASPTRRIGADASCGNWSSISRLASSSSTTRSALHSGIGGPYRPL